MAIVVYQCDTCKRQIEIQRNIEGMEHVGRCNITHGCRGKLFQVNLHPDYIRGSLPDPVVGLDDWKQRKVLHNHQQPIERTEWIIIHEMGVVPNVSVFGDRPIEDDLNNQIEITPDDVVIIDNDTVKLVFSRPWSGIAQLTARQSDPDLLRPYTRTVEEVADPVQMSSSGEISIATKISSFTDSSPIALEMTYATPTGTTNVVSYSVDTEPSINSPWVDYNRVIVKGNIYTVRSFNGLVPEMTTGVIGSGSTIQFTGIDPTGVSSPVPIEAGEVLVLLSSTPFTPVDKILDQYIDVSDVSDETNTFGFYYNNGEFFSTPDVPKSVYPFIRSV